MATRVLRGESFVTVLAAFLDAFSDADPDDRQAMIDDAPPSLGDARLDALLGAVAEHLALMWGLEVPDWAQEPSRFLADEHVPPTICPPTPDSDPRWVPLAFARRRIVVRGEPLLGGRPPPELDGFLLKPVGAPPGRPDLRLHARRGAYPEGSDPAYASLAVAVPRAGGIGRAYALVSLGPPALHLLGTPLPSGALAAAAL